jgi:hypothetical protein
MEKPFITTSLKGEITQHYELENQQGITTWKRCENNIKRDSIGNRIWTEFRSLTTGSGGEVF